MHSLLPPNVPSCPLSLSFTRATRTRPLFSHPSTCCAFMVSPGIAAAAVSGMSTLSCGGWLKKNYSVTFHKAVSSRMSIPARDRVIDFGKYKGRMLGTLPSKYLTWVSKNLRARDFEEWAKLADDVLQDPIYRDRIEWEFAERVLSGNSHRDAATDSPVSELLDISERFSWDNDDKTGWARINFELLGTSIGGRIPRKNGRLLHGLAKEGIKGTGNIGNTNKISAGQERKERSRLFQEISSVKGSLFGSFESHAIKAPGSLKTSSYATKISRSFDSKRVMSVNEKKLSVLKQEKQMTADEVEEFEGTLRERRQQRRQKQNLRRQQLHALDREVTVVKDGKDRIMVTKQNDRSNVNSNFNLFPGRDQILKRINK